MEDGHLLRRWVEEGDGSAVRVLTRRHAALVTGVAKRALSGNQSLAEEAAQAVFTAMVAKASSLLNHPALNLWLHRAALLEASGLRRREARRHRRIEALAAEPDFMNPSDPAPSWHRVLPELDEALERLPEADRHVLILRYYEGRNFRDIGARLRKSDDTVQKQVSRALEKLAGLLRRRGVVISAAVLAAGLGSAGLAPPAAAAVTADYAATAILRAPHLGFAEKSWQTIQLMTYGKSTTLTLTAAAVLLLALSTGGGYYAGTVSEAAAPALTSGADAGGSFQNARRPPLPKSAPGKGAGGTAEGKRGKPPLQDILEAASSIRMSLTGDWSMYSEDMYPTLGHYDPAHTEEAIALLGGFRRDDVKFESVSGVIFSALADHDWRAAKRRMMSPDALRHDGKLSGQAVRAVAEAWGRENPAEAFRWANGLIDAGRTPFDAERGVGEGLLADWLVRDERGAMAEMERRLENQTPLVGQAVEKSIGGRPEWWLDRLSPGADPASRSQALRLARSSLVLLSPKQRQESVSRWVNDPGLSAELLQSAP